MAWRLLTIFSLLALAGAAVFSYFNWEELKTERILLERSERNLVAITERQQQGDDELAMQQGFLDDTIEVRDDHRQKSELTNAEIAEVTAETSQLRTQLGALNQQLAQLREKIQELGQVGELVAKLEGLTSSIASKREELIGKEERLTGLLATTENRRESIEGIRDLEGRQLRSEMDANFTGRIAQVFPDFGFVAMNHGNLDGVYATATLEVKRAGERIAELKVRSVEQRVSFLDVVPGSVAEGVYPQAGDLVTVVERRSEPVVGAAPGVGAPGAPLGIDPGAPAAMPASGVDPLVPAAPGGSPFDDALFGDAPVPPAIPAADPFAADDDGAMGVDLDDPAAGVPFGDDAPAMEPVPGADPFGADDVMVEPAPADPFGADEAMMDADPAMAEDNPFSN